LEEILSLQHNQLSQQQDLLGIVAELKNTLSSLSTSTPSQESQDMKHLKTLLNQLQNYWSQPTSVYPVSMTSTLMFGLS
jgi:conjugal transfer/entry exclusion protein